MNLQEPVIEAYLDAASDPEHIIWRAIEHSDDVERTRFDGAALGGFSSDRLEFNGCRFVRCNFSAFEIKRLSFTDCSFEHCDFSNFEFAKCSFLRVCFEQCRLTGATFQDTALSHVRFSDCLLQYMALGKCALRYVAFSHCDMNNSAFHEIKHEGLTLTECRLRASEWATKLAGVDLSTCELQGLTVSEGALRGAIVSAAQLLDLASLIGVVVK